MADTAVVASFDILDPCSLEPEDITDAIKLLLDQTGGMGESFKFDRDSIVIHEVQAHDQKPATCPNCASTTFRVAFDGRVTSQGTPTGRLMVRCESCNHVVSKEEADEIGLNLPELDTQPT